MIPDTLWRAARDGPGDPAETGTLDWVLGRTLYWRAWIRRAWILAIFLAGLLATAYAVSTFPEHRFVLTFLGGAFTWEALEVVPER